MKAGIRFIERTCWSSARAERDFVRRSKPRRPARTWRSSADRFLGRRTRSWRKAASLPPLPASIRTTRGKPTSAIRWPAANTSTIGGWRSCSREKRLARFTISSGGVRSSIARRKAVSCSGSSAVTRTAGSFRSRIVPALSSFERCKTEPSNSISTCTWSTRLRSCCCATGASPVQQAMSAKRGALSCSKLPPLS
jgi:hypothetical protein